MLEALPTALAPLNLFFATVGVIVGAIFGAIPGLTATLAIALFVPVTFAMEATHGLTMLGGIYAGAIFGGSRRSKLCWDMDQASDGGFGRVRDGLLKGARILP